MACFRYAAAMTYVYSKALYYGLFVTARLAFEQLTSPTKCLWRPKIRVTPPECLSAEHLGKHGYVTVEVWDEPEHCKNISVLGSPSPKAEGK